MALKPRIVVVGLGSIGRRHARLLAARGDLQVEWCEALPEALAFARKEIGEPAASHASWAEALSSQPDMVVIATPHAQHAEQAIAASRAGIHVLCEKPLSDSLVRAREMVAAAESSRAVFTVGFQLHFHPALQRVKALLREGAVGSVHHAHALVGTYITLVNSKSRYQASLRGALFLDYAHQPDVFHYLLGTVPRGVYATGGQGGRLPLRSNPNFAAVVCDYAEPLISTIHLNYLQMPDRHEYEIVGDEGWIAVDMFKGEMRIGRQRDESTRVEHFPNDKDSWYRFEHEAFLQAIAGSRPPESPARDALISMEVIDATLRSFESRQREALTLAPRRLSNLSPQFQSD